MVLGRLGDAVSDLKETLRRVFRDPPSHALETSLGVVSARAVPALASEARLPAFALAASPVQASLALDAQGREEPMVFHGSLQTEEGWARWAAGAKVCAMPVFAGGAQRRMEVPALPRQATGRRLALEGLRAEAHQLRPGLASPAVRGGCPELGRATARGALELALGLPIAIQGQDVQSLPKAQWMRYSLQLVKATGENIRNLEVLGFYRIPVRGVGSMRHDAATGKLLLELTREASGASRVPFLLARRKDDRTLVSCFLEEG